MHTIQAVITGVIQGLSEFLPVSSSAHIVFSNEIYSLITNTKISTALNQEEIFFDIMIHLATLAAVIIYFFDDLKKIFKDFFIALKEKDYKNENFKLFNYIVLSTIITGIVGICLKDRVESLIINPKIICFLLPVTGIVLLLSEKAKKQDKPLDLKSSIIIAIAQGLALFPGFSRSGFTISAALFCGIDKVKAARFSFLMSIPVIILAGLIYPLFELDFSTFINFNFKAIILGALSAFVVGYLCIKYFMKLLGRINLKIFSYYCFAVSIIMFFVFAICYHS